MPTFTWVRLARQGNWFDPNGNQTWDWTTDWPSVLPLDPYLVWADVTDRIDFDKSRRVRVPIMLEFNTAQVAQTAIDRLKDPRIGNGKIADIYLADPTGNNWKLIGKTRFATAFVGPRFFRRFAANTLANFRDLIKRFVLTLPVDADGISARGVSFMSFPSGTNVVLGLIDDGLPFASAATRGAIRQYWDQESGRERLLPEKFSYGAEYGPLPDGTHKIDDWITKSMGPGNRLDEEAVYARARLPQLRQRVTHGSAVLSVAAKSTATPAQPAIVCVQLPTRTTRDSSGASLGGFVLDALHYILFRAENGAPNQGLPVVANLSYGDFAGPHDGSSMLEAAIDDLVDACARLTPPVALAVVVPAGNSMQSRCHAAFTLDNNVGLSRTLHWKIQPDDVTPSFLEIWLPASDVGSSISVMVSPPGGTTASPAISRGQHFGMYEAQASGYPVCCVIFPQISAKSDGTRRMILVAVAPTASLNTRALAPSGHWQVSITSTAVVTGTIDAWIQRDDAPFGYPKKGRQSYFDDPNYVRFTENGDICESDDDPSKPFEGNRTQAYVKRRGTLSGIATGARTIVVGGYRKSDKPGAEEPARYSSSGPVSRAGHPAPLLAQVSEDSHFHPGVLAGGTHSGSSSGFNGTSIAAPQVVNELLQAFAGTGSPGLTQSSGSPWNRVGIIPNSPPGSFNVGPLRITPALGSVPDDRVGLGLDVAPTISKSRKRREVD